MVSLIKKCFLLSSLSTRLFLRQVFSDCSRYSAEEIHFNLMAVVSDRKHLYLREIERLNSRKQQYLEMVINILQAFDQLYYAFEYTKVLFSP